MSYQVLARKWRPRTFKQLVGQAHVLQALVNALDNDRLHHAYLFTGTRGVGKTTIARILAKCLNCEQGVSSVPCGECSSCNEINEGRFIDLIEVDAASRTKVEDTRELLDNVQYAPTRGRYKVYLIDEVHMLSTHSFNALLKTLEEPPPHVKFLLATTDPQKLPVTILSRCLQFSLKNMSPERIVGHLEHVLDAEKISYELPALWKLGRSADGSMRDALSLTDQAIAFGNGQVSESDVSSMLGSIDQTQVYEILEGLIAKQGASVLSAVASLAEHAPDFSNVLAELLALLHRMALAQAVPSAVDNSQGDRERVLDLAQRLTAEDVHLFYQIALLGRKDLALAPDPRAGFEMVMLRMLAFRPNAQAQAPIEQLADVQVNEEAEPQKKCLAAPESAAAEKPQALEADRAELTAEPVPEASLEAPVSAPQIPDEPEAPTSSEVLAPWEDQPDSLSASAPQAEPAAFTAPEKEPAALKDAEEPAPTPSADAVMAATAPPAEASAEALVPEEPEPCAAEVLSLSELSPQNWNRYFKGFGLAGVTQSLASHCEFNALDGQSLSVRVAPENATLLNETHRSRIEQALSTYFSSALKFTIDIAPCQYETPAQYQARKQAERLRMAHQSLLDDPNIQALQQRFSATIVGDSVQPIDG